MKEACGLCGVYSFSKEEPVAKSVYFGLFALQHRGQESAGLASSDGKKLKNHRGMGLVSAVINYKLLNDFKGHLAIGHVRYSTTGSSNINNAQPIYVSDSRYGPFTLAHNGNLINMLDLRKELKDKGHKFKGNSDSEVIAALLCDEKEKDIEKALLRVTKKIQGAYSLLIMTLDKLIALKDPNGVRPLCVGKLPNAYVIASETCALDIIGAQFLREIANGEMVVVDKNGLRSATYSTTGKMSLCVFEFIYFARPDSIIMGRNVYEARIAMGKYLASQHPADSAEIVAGVPDSGIPAAIGFSSESKIPFGDVLIKNRYVGRTFIQPTQEIRDMGVKAKLNPLRETIRDKSLVIIDDSIVRGTTSRQIVKIIKDAGARKINFRISSPPIVSPCFYGIDTPTKAELIAANLSVEGIRKYLDADSLGYLSLESLVKAVNLPWNSVCLGCLNGEYPIKIPEQMETLKLIFK